MGATFRTELYLTCDNVRCGGFTGAAMSESCYDNLDCGKQRPTVARLSAKALADGWSTDGKSWKCPRCNGGRIKRKAVR